MLTTPEEIKGIFTAPPDVLHPGEGARTLEPIVGRNSVILLDGDSHMEQRKLMLPAFHGERMKRLEGLVAAVTEREVASWGPEPSVELHPRMQGLTLEVILRAVFGLDPGERLDALRARLGAMLAYGESPMTLFINPSPRMERLFNRFGPMAGFVDLREEVDRLVFELVDERRDAHEERDDVLSMLLEARHEDGSPMSDQELRDELMTLLVAGHETTASSLAWAFERLVRDPAVLGTLVSEIDSGDGDAYVTATIQETLRRRPVLPTAAPRLIKKPIEVGGWEYEPGACLVPCSYLLHHDPEVYPDPYAFRPERFLDSRSGDLHLDPVRRRSPALPRRRVRAARDADRPRQRPPQLRAAPGWSSGRSSPSGATSRSPPAAGRGSRPGSAPRRPSRRSPEPAP